MANKLQQYTELSKATAGQLTSSYEEWTAFLATAGRLYKYPFPDQMMIYAQRPDATACAEYDVWNQKMRRYVLRGSSGIALIDTSGDKARLRYVFDVSDTGGMENARRPMLWQYRPEHQQVVAAALKDRFGAPGENGFAKQLEYIAAHLAAEYWDNYQGDIARIIDGSFLEEYDEFTVGEQFQNAIYISTAYTVMSRCGLEPESYFQHEDFMSVFDFSTIPAATALGMAVSQNSAQVLRQIEAAIKTFERVKLAERSTSHEQRPDVQPERGLPRPEPDAGGSAHTAPGEIREDAPEVSEGAAPGSVGGNDRERDLVPAPAGNRADSQREAGSDDVRVGEVSGSDRGPESQRSHEVGGTDEHLQGSGGGNDFGGAGVQLNSVQSEGQISLFPSERQQIETIREAENVEALSAPSVSEGDIDAVLKAGTGYRDNKFRIYAMYQNGISPKNAVALLKKEYGTSISSYTLLDGTEGHVDSNPAKGFVFWLTPGGKSTTVSWSKVEKRLRQLIAEGSYLTPEELEQHQNQAAITDADVDKLLTEDWGIKGRKERIFFLYRQGLSDKQIAEHLRAEYNKHGYTQEERAHEGPCVLADGSEGYGYFVAAEWRLRRTDADAPMRNISYEEIAKHIRGLIEAGRYLTPEEMEQAAPPAEAPPPSHEAAVKEAPPAPREVTQADIDAALQNWNGDIASKRRVQQYMENHAREKDTAKWLKEEYGEDFPAYPVHGDGVGTDLSWPKVQRHLARLVREGRFFTPEELDDFADVDTAAVREALEQGKPSPFVEQVMEDVAQIAAVQDAAASEEKSPTVREIYEQYKPIVKELVLANIAYQNACKNSDKATALMEGREAVKRAALSFTDDENTPFVRLYLDMADFRSRLHREILDETYPMLAQVQQEQTVEKAYVVSDVPTIYCEWSENPVFEDGKTYSIYDFDRLMKQADTEYTEGKASAIKKYGTWQKWYDANDPETSRFLSYDEVKFTIVLPDGRTFTERQDIGDGEGGLLDFLGNYRQYREIVPLLQEAVQKEQERIEAEVQPVSEAPDFSGKPVVREGDTITIGDGPASHEIDITVSDEEWQTIQEVVGAADQPPHDPLAPAYAPGDMVYLDNTAFEIVGIGLLDVNLQDPALPIPLMRAESRENFERLLHMDPRNDHIVQYLSADMSRVNDDFREVLTGHLLTDRDKDYISGWLRSGENNRGIAQRLSLVFASRAETVTLETGDIADYFTSTISMAVEIQDKFGTKLSLSWEAVAPILRAMYQQELDGFTHEPVRREPVELEGKLSYQVGDKVAFAYGDHDVVGTIESIGELDILIHTGPYAWSHETVSRDFFEDALRHDERNADLFTQKMPEQETPEVAAPNTSAQPNVSEFHSSQNPPIPAQPVQQVPVYENFRITDDNLGVGGPRVKYQMNVAAIRTLKQIEAEGRSATAAEQEVLSRYVGWGGVPDAFDKNKTSWLKEYDELKELLTPEEYKSAMSSTLNAHYTSPMVIKAIYETIGSMGFETGKILEPSCGVGNFFGLLPESMAASKLYGVELDSITGRIAQQLYPNAQIAVQGFEKTKFRDGFFDLAVGNVPFGSYSLVDQRYDRNHFLIHDYFFAKTIDMVRPGGVIAFITSNGISGGTMDKKDDRARRYIAQRCDLLGAVRLPDGAFRANAGTDTSMSILFLQKREIPLLENDPLPDWVTADVIKNHTYVKDGEERHGFISMNRYFKDHPEMVLGDLKITSGPYGPQLECRPRKDTDLSQQLREALSNIHGEITRPTVMETVEDAVEESMIPADPGVKNYSFTVIDGEVYYREDSEMVKSTLSGMARERVIGMVGLRDCVHRLIELQMEDNDEAAITRERESLNALYDDFTQRFGLLNSRENAQAFSQDNAYYLLCSLEIVDEDGKLERKADMFTKRTIKPHQAVTHVDTASEALAVSIGERARVDLSYMAQLTGKAEDALEAELQGVIFRDIQCPERADWIPKAHMDLKRFPVVAADEYLSGNVRQKLRMVKAMYEALPDEEKHLVWANVEALEASQPKDLDASEIDLRLGATWLDKNYVQQFMYELFDTTYQEKQHIRVNFSEYTGEWNITGKTRVSAFSIAARTTYGTDAMNAYDILEDTLNLRDVRVYKTIMEDGKERRVLDQTATTLAAQKQQAIKDAFRDWIWKDPARRQDLERQYNELFNSIRPREYDGQHIVFGGINPEITLREHQLNAIAHALYGGNTLLAHEVGAGKTFEMVAAAMEAKRLGLCHKSLFAVPNHLIEQWASEFLRLYPSANILVTRKQDFEAKNRKKFCARIATGSYDAIIMGHSQFERLPVSYERRKALLEDQIAELEQGIDEMEADGAERFSVKQLERTKKSLEARLEKLTSTHRKDDVVTFEQLGVDRLFVDEAHSYKNLFLYTKMRNVAGLSTTDAQKSSDMLLKCRYMDEITGGRGVVFATGTPVSNSMTELFTMQRYLQQSLLEKGFTDSRGRHHSLTHFDSWASIFGETVTTVELAPEGKYRPRTRFARFFNLPELMAMFRECADIKTADQLHLPVPEAEYHVEKAQPSEQQKLLVQDLSARAAAIHSGQVNPKIDNMLKITSDGRKLGLDQRLIDPNFPDNPDSKVNMCVNNVFRIWRDGQKDKLTQLIFSDLSTPKAAVAATRDKTAMAAGNKIAGGTELHALGNLMADIQPDPPFSVYEDIRGKLVSLGIPEREIAFIHDANTDVKKKSLFAKVRSGQVRVLMGSTFKMGAGMNVQDRLIALHDLDCPWRPGDLEQRKGRIVRQGNSNQTVHIYRYVTEGTFDSYLWQTVENKQKFISQIMTSKSPVRSCEDVDETALSYAEIKALCAGNPLIKEKMDLDIDVARLRLLKADHQSHQYRMEDDLTRRIPQQIKENEGFIAGLEADMKTLEAHPHPVIVGEKPVKADGEPCVDTEPSSAQATEPGDSQPEETVSVKKGFAGMVLHGETITDRAEAGKLLIAEMRPELTFEPVEIGSYRGFSMALSLENCKHDYILTLRGEMTHRVELSQDVFGNFLRMDHALEKMPSRIDALRIQIKGLQRQMEALKGEVGKPFPQEAELQKKTTRLTELNVQLGIDDSAAQPEPQQRLAKSPRPSVLNNLKRPLPPRQPDYTSRGRKPAQER